MSVELVAPPVARRPHEAPPRRSRTETPLPPPPPELMRPTPPPRESAGEPLAGPSGLDDDVREALRGLVGCAPGARLTPEARARCDEREAERAALNLEHPLSLKGRSFTGHDPTAYLLRRPHNACKPRAAGDRLPFGREGAAAGVDCAFSF